MSSDEAASRSITLTIRGGCGGTAARLDDLERAGALLATAAWTMAGVAVRAARVAADPQALLSAPVSPLTWSIVQRRLSPAVGPPGGAVVVAARLAALAAASRGAVATYRAADATVDAGLHALDVAVGRAVGTWLALPAVTTVAIAPFAVTTGALEVLALAGAGADVPGAPASSTATSARRLLSLLAAHPDPVEHAVGALPGVVSAWSDSGPGPAVLAALLTGMPVVPPDVPGASGWLGRLASRGPWLRETGRVQVTARPAVPVRAPGGLQSIVQGIATLDPERGAPPGTVRVVAVDRPGAGRAWIVEVPGTQSWEPVAGGNPLDLTGDVQGLAGKRTAGGALVGSALRQAGAAPTEPVLLAGHSQGGIVAAQLAADPAFRASYRVTHVVTLGAPVASVPVPPGVAVLSLEHGDDLVPRLDGARNPDRPSWVTVSRTASAGAEDPLQAHGLPAYARTAAAVDGAGDPALVRWRQGLEPFLTGPGVSARAQDFTGRRW